MELNLRYCKCGNNVVKVVAFIMGQYNPKAIVVDLITNNIDVVPPTVLTEMTFDEEIAYIKSKKTNNK